MSTEVSRQFSDEEIHMANASLEKYTSFLAIREMQIKNIRLQSLTRRNDYHQENE